MSGHARGGRVLSARGARATGSVTHSPESPLFERRTGLGGPTAQVARAPLAATRPASHQRRS